MTLLITGSNGFTGKYLCKQFQNKNYDVVGLVESNPDSHEIICDLTDKDAVKKVIEDIKPTGIIHLAALAYVAHDNPAEFYKVNVFGTTNLLEALNESGIKPEKIIIASSANVYGNPGVDIITEDITPSPVNHYATSKLAMEYMVKNWFDKYPMIITRPFNYTGPGQDELFLAPKIVSHYRDKKDSIELGNIDIARNFADVRDIARAYLSLYESTVTGEIINLSSGRAYELRELIELMNEISGYEINIEVNQAFIRENDIKILNGSNEKLRSLIDYKPEYSLKDTLSDMYHM